MGAVGSHAEGWLIFETLYSNLDNNKPRLAFLQEHVFQ